MKDEDMVINKTLIDLVNNDENIPWRAGVNSIFEGKRFGDIKHLLRAGFRDVRSHIVSRSSKKMDIPDTFDVYDKWAKCKHPIRNQEQCGSCWAFSCTESMSDRFCVKGVDVIFSPQYILSCNSDNYGCEGGYLTREWDFLKSNGVCSDSCLPYSSGGGVVEKCPDKCKDGSPIKLYKVSNFTHYRTFDEAQVDMMEYGSILTTYDIYTDFFNYISGVYVHKSGFLCGNHAVKIQGWGIDSASGLEYWNVANSWGSTWGMDGYFWIKRGTNECGVEDDMWGGYPIVGV